MGERDPVCLIPVDLLKSRVKIIPPIPHTASMEMPLVVIFYRNLWLRHPHRLLRLLRMKPFPKVLKNLRQRPRMQAYVCCTRCWLHCRGGTLGRFVRNFRRRGKKRWKYHYARRKNRTLETVEKKFRDSGSFSKFDILQNFSS